MTTTGVNPRLAAALLYAAIGWPVLPLHTPDEFGACDCKDGTDCEDVGKHPRTLHGLDDASTDESTIRRWWAMWPNANVAIDLARSGLVDVAPDSIEWFAEFTARGLPPTLSFASGGGEGHAHHLFARPEGCAVYRNCVTGQYDVLSNGYAVAPPSLHKTGRTYTWLDPADGILLTGPTEPAPDWAVEMLNARARRTTTPSDDIPDEDAPPVDLRGDALERWYGRLFEARADGGVDRSYSLWWLAVVLLEAGCRPRFVEQLLAERDDALGWRKFTNRTDAAARYRIIVERALESQGPGHVGSSKTRTQKPPTPEPEPAEWVTAAELKEVEDEEVTWYAHGLLGAGLITELDGKAKQSGKTTLVLAMAYAILHGEEFLGQPTQYSRILYLTEQSGPSFKRNLSRAGLLDRDDFHILMWNRVVGRKWATIVADARAKAKEVDANVLIIDTLAQFSGIRGEDENKSGAAMETMEPIQAATQDKLAILSSRHDRKSGGEVGDSGRGSSAFAGAVDIVLHLQRLPVSESPGRERQRMLDGISRFDETPDKLLIELVPGEEGERSSYTAVGDKQKVDTESLKIEILASLPRSAVPDAPTFKELQGEFGMRAFTVRRALKELEVVGLVNHFGWPHRYYQVVPRDSDA